MSAQTWRRRALFGALVMVIALSAADSGNGWYNVDERVVPARPGQAQDSRSPEQSLPSVELERLQRRNAPADSDNLAGNTFGAMSWYVPPPPPPPKPAAKPLPPPPPAAPPVPFSFMGRYEDGGTRIILLVKGDRIYTVTEGEVIDKTYRVERLAGGQLELTYLPLDIKQTISAGET
jgi:hypothetical protein